MYGKLAEVTEGRLLSPRFSVSVDSCLRFAFYLRGEIQVGFTLYMYDYQM